MGALSIFLGCTSAVLLVAGALLTVVPFVGVALSFAAPVLALAGVMVGGIAMSRAKNGTGSSGLAVAGVVLSALAFFPAVVVAMTCGVCNACVSAGFPGGKYRFGGTLGDDTPAGGSSTPGWGAGAAGDARSPDGGRPGDGDRPGDRAPADEPGGAAGDPGAGAAQGEAPGGGQVPPPRERLKGAPPPAFPPPQFP